MGIGAGGAAAIAAGGSIAGAGISAMGAQSAAGKQAAAADKAAQTQLYMYNQTRSDLSPFTAAAQANLPAYQNYWQQSAPMLKGYLDQMQANLPPNMTEDELVKTPGYQFNLSQGLKAVQNANAAKGLGISGTALKGAANFATGLADSTYQNQFNNAQTRFADYGTLFSNALAGNQQVFNQLYSPVSLGENAAAQVGNNGATLAQAAGNAQMAAGQAQAAGIGTAAGALNQGINGAGNALMTYAMMKGAGGNPLGPGGYGTTNANDPYNGLSGISQATQDSIASSAASAPTYSGMPGIY